MSAPESFSRHLTDLRRGQGLSLRGLARLAGVSHDTLGAWERGARWPRLPELEAVLTALEVSRATRYAVLAQVSAALSVRQIRPAEAGASGEEMPGAGHLLRAMRNRRGLTQADTAGLAGVSQGRLGSWERSEDWPSAERLHRLCFVLGAHPDEVKALTYGRGVLPAWNEEEDAEAWAGQKAVSPDDPLGRLLKHTYFFADALRDLRFLSLEQSLWLRARDNEAFRSHLHDLYAYQARAMMEEGRFGEVGVSADRTWNLARQGYGRSQFWTWSVIASAKALKRDAAGRRTRLDQAASLLASMTPQAESRESQAWMLCELSLALAEAGRCEEALRVCAQAQEMAEHDAIPQEVLFRRRDHAALLSALGRHEEALDVLETAAELLSYGADPVVRHHLLAAACYLGLRNTDAAQEALTLALDLIQRQTDQAEQGNAQISCLRTQAEALLARL